MKFKIPADEFQSIDIDRKYNYHEDRWTFPENMKSKAILKGEWGNLYSQELPVDGRWCAMIINHREAGDGNQFGIDMQDSNGEEYWIASEPMSKRVHAG